MQKQWYFALHDDPQVVASKGYRNVEGLSIDEALTFFDYTIRREMDNEENLHPVVGCIIRVGIKDDPISEDKVYIPLKTIDDPEYQGGLLWAKELDEVGWDVFNNDLLKQSLIEYDNYFKEEQFLFMKLGRRLG